MHYVGEKLSYTGLHQEDRGLSSINLLKYGNEKVWLIVDYYRWQAEVEKNAADYLSTAQNKLTCNKVLKRPAEALLPT